MTWALVTKPKLLNDMKLRSKGKKALKVNIKSANKEIPKETGERKGYQRKNGRSWRIPRVQAPAEDPDSPR